MKTTQMNNGAVVMADERCRPQLFSREAALALARSEGPTWTIEIARTAPRYYVVRADSRPNQALNSENPL